MIFGAGLESCGTWTKARQGDPIERQIVEAWVDGYLAGSNLGSSRPDALYGRDANGIYGWMDNYCRNNPLKAIVAAATLLMAELISQAR